MVTEAYGPASMVALCTRAGHYHTWMYHCQLCRVKARRRGAEGLPHICEYTFIGRNKRDETRTGGYFVASPSASFPYGGGAQSAAAAGGYSLPGGAGTGGGAYGLVLVPPLYWPYCIPCGKRAEDESGRRGGRRPGPPLPPPPAE
jgi:hypothetical protein